MEYDILIQLGNCQQLRSTELRTVPSIPVFEQGSTHPSMVRDKYHDVIIPDTAACTYYKQSCLDWGAHGVWTYVLDRGHALTDICRPDRVCSKSIERYSSFCRRRSVRGKFTRYSKLSKHAKHRRTRLSPNELPLPVQRRFSFSSLSNLSFSTFFASFDKSHQAH